jgi:hypothetical protein
MIDHRVVEWLTLSATNSAITDQSHRILFRRYAVADGRARAWLSNDSMLGGRLDYDA